MTYDIAVAGGGVAGVAAAVEAARMGKKVVLIEKTTQLGGLATIGRVNFFVPMCNGRGVQICKGMADEFLRLSIRYGYDTLPQDWQRGEPGFGNTQQRLCSRYSAPIFSLALCKLLRELNVDIYFDTVITDAPASHGRITSLTLFNKSGFHTCRAQMFIDATGDADVLHYVGVPTVTGGNFHSYHAYCATLETCARAVQTQDIGQMTYWERAGSATLYGTGHPEGMPLWDGTDGKQVSDYLISNQLELLDKLSQKERTSRDITLLPIMPQFRTTRHIDGEYTLTTQDAYRHFEDSVCAICDFDNRDVLYEVPYGTMIRKGFPNVIAVGRCAAATGYAWDVLRVIPPAILTGQAAGAAAALALDSTQDITSVHIPTLQAHLASRDVMIHFDDAWIPADTSAREQVDVGHI